MVYVVRMGALGYAVLSNLPARAPNELATYVVEDMFTLDELDLHYLEDMCN